MTSSEKNSQRVLLLILTCCLVSQTRLWADGQTSDPAQVSITRTPDAAPVLSDRARRQLQEKLESAATTPLQIVDVDGAPLEITGTKVRSIKIEGNYDDPSSGAIINDYAMKLSFRLANRSGKLVTGAGLEFTNTQENNVFFVYPVPVTIEPGKSKKFEISFMAVTGDPAHLSLQVAGARFGDDSTWEGFPFPKPRAGRRAPLCSVANRGRATSRHETQTPKPSRISSVHRGGTQESRPRYC